VLCDGFIIVAWRIAAQVMFAIGYIIQFISLCLTIVNQVFGCCKQKIFSKETCPMIFGVLIAVASELTDEVRCFYESYRVSQISNHLFSCISSI